jgi:hypothetical protein
MPPEHIKRIIAMAVAGASFCLALVIIGLLLRYL